MVTKSACNALYDNSTRETKDSLQIDGFFVIRIPGKHSPYSDLGHHGRHNKSQKFLCGQFIAAGHVDC